MALYIHLVRLTDQGVKNIGNYAKVLEDTRKIIESNGAKVVHSWSTLGRYDIVAVLEAPDDATAMKVSAQIARAGNFRPETLPAVRMREFEKSVSK